MGVETMAGELFGEALVGGELVGVELGVDEGPEVEGVSGAMTSHRVAVQSPMMTVLEESVTAPLRAMARPWRVEEVFSTTEE
jgi:hypothetical protein